MYVGVFIATVLLAGVAVLPVAATESEPVSTGESATDTAPIVEESELDATATDYAAATGVDLPTAKRRAPLMEQARQTMFTLRAYAGDSLACLFWQHEPELSIQLKLAAEPDEALSRVIAKSPVPVIVETDALFSREEANERVDLALPALRVALPEVQGVSLDGCTAEARVGVYREEGAELDPDWQARIDQAIASFAEEAGLPVRVEYHSSREMAH
jgi:hypothetical protein